MKFTIVRHGETEDNLDRRLAGRVDKSLNDRGRDQARALIPQLRGKGFDIIFSSPLARARETGEILSPALGIPIEFHDGLQERDFGFLAGRSWEEMQILSGASFDLRIADGEQEYDYRPYGGESIGDVRARLDSFIAYAKTQPFKKPLVVSHGGAMRCLYYFYGGLERMIHIPNASIHELDL